MCVCVETGEKVTWLLCLVDGIWGGGGKRVGLSDGQVTGNAALQFELWFPSLLSQPTKRDGERHVACRKTMPD